MGTIDNSKPTAVPAAKPSYKERLAQAREYAKQFKFETISPEQLKKTRRNAYAYLF